MLIDIITIFPEIFDFYLNQSLISKAQKKGVLKIKTHQLRDFTNDKHNTVDDKPFGGGRGMVLKFEPLYKAIQKIKNQKLKIKNTNQKLKVILFSPRGKKFTQKMATNWAKQDQLIFVCGRYEAIDERVAKNLATDIVSIGDYVLMGGELPALVAIESVARLLPGAVGNSESLIGERITKTGGFVEYPQYTRPEVVCVDKKGRSCPPNSSTKQKCWRVPKVLLSGNHKKIDEWREKYSKIIS
ncbi:MAG: tRNA (guanosine(37)-N1)-methyltransferase TrmD [Candidatus Pacebacteria bacterium]|nr:tRNA (guanosine(37)-N1)-methyltransferase TrmD [Candidatus Paceibacterota bacterium]